MTYDQANVIATADVGQSESSTIANAGPTEVKFEQTINAPSQLSTADIYRQSRNLITLAKEELSIS